MTIDIIYLTKYAFKATLLSLSLFEFNTNLFTLVNVVTRSIKHVLYKFKFLLRNQTYISGICGGKSWIMANMSAVPPSGIIV